MTYEVCLDSQYLFYGRFNPNKISILCKQKLKLKTILSLIHIGEPLLVNNDTSNLLIDHKPTFSLASEKV